MENTVHEIKRRESSSMLVIGQDMHIMNPDLIRAVERKDREMLAGMAEKQVAAGAQALDLHLSSAKKDNRRVNWTLATIRNAADVPLFVSAHILSHPELLAEFRGPVTVNSVTADPAALPAAMKTAGEHGARLVVLLVRPGLTPFTADERLQVAVDVLETAVQSGFPLADLYLDPLFHLRPDPVTWQLSGGVPDVDSVLETIAMLPQLTGEGVRTLAALSSASQFLPRTERSGLDCRLLPLLLAAGLDAVILNCHDSRLMEIARNPNSSLPNDLPLLPQGNVDMNTAALYW